MNVDTEHEHDPRLSPYGVSLRDIYLARQRIADAICRTPLVPSSALSEQLGADVRLKLETLQPTGAFKLRGATNKLRALSPAERERGVVAVSSGNHGRGVAYAARRLGMRAIICMGSLVPENKRENIRALGAEVRIVGDSQQEAQEEADRLVKKEAMVEAHPFDDVWVIAGQGTIGLELLEDMPELDTVVVPLSGGGLIGGIALALKSTAKRIRVVGVSMERGAAMAQSIAAGKPIPVKELPTLADALGGGIGLDNARSFALVRDFVDEIVLVSEEQIAQAMRYLLWKEQLVAEGAGAVGVAALLNDLLTTRGERVAIVISGRNVDMHDFMATVGDHRSADT